MIEITPEGKKRRIQGIPPCDGREWKSIVDVAKKLGISRAGVWYHIRRWEWRTYRQNRNRTWILKADVESYLEFIRSKQRWRERHRPKSWRAEVGIIEDEDLLKRVFLTTTQAALMMGVHRSAIIRWGQKGKVAVFKSSHASKQKWYSPSDLRRLRDDVEHLQRRASWKKGKETGRAGIVSRQAYKLRYKPQVHHNVPVGWLTTLEAAEYLDVAISTIHTLRRKGRLFGKQWIKGKLQDTRDWWEPEKTRNRPWFFPMYALEEHKNDPDAQRWREIGKRARAMACRK